MMTSAATTAAPRATAVGGRLRVEDLGTVAPVPGGPMRVNRVVGSPTTTGTGHA